MPGAADTPVGAPGTVYNVRGADAVEALLVRVELVALTVNVYATPLVRPVITIDDAGYAIEADNPPCTDLAV